MNMPAINSYACDYHYHDRRAPKCYEETPPFSVHDDTETVKTNSEDSAAPESQLVELNTRDPWPPDHPLRNLCDEFLTMFQEAYSQVLEEKGLKTQGKNQAVILAANEVDEVCQAVAAKLAANPEALEMMRKLNVSFESEAKLKGQANTMVPSVEEAEEEDILLPDGAINKEAWQRRYEEMIANDDYSGLLRLYNPSGNSPVIPGANYSWGFSNVLSGKENTFYDIIKYEEYFREVHDDVLRELRLDPGTMSEGSPEALEAIRLIGEKIMASPEGRQLLANVGYTCINHLGLPCTLPGAATNGDPEPVMNPAFHPDNEDKPEPIQTNGPKEKPAKIRLNDMLTKGPLQDMTSAMLFMNALGNAGSRG